MVVAVGHDQPSLRVELHCVRRPEFARPRAGAADDPEEIPRAVEYRNAPDQIGIRDVRVALRHVDVTVPQVRHDVGRVGQRVGRIASDARRPQCHQHVAVRAELDDHTSLVAFSGKRLKLVGACRSCVGHPHVAVSIDMDAMRPDEHPRPEASDLLSRLVEQVNGVRVGTDASRGRARRASIDRPHGNPSLNRPHFLVDAREHLPQMPRQHGGRLVEQHRQGPQRRTGPRRQQQPLFPQEPA